MSGGRRKMVARLAAALVAGLLAGSGPPAPACGQQDPDELRPRAVPLPPVGQDPHRLFDLRRRLLELDKLLSLGSTARARGLIEDLAQHSVLAEELTSRRITLAQLERDHHRAIALARDALGVRPADPALWRSLATSLLAAGEPDSARLALDRFMTYSQNRRSAAVVAVDQCLNAGRPAMAVGMIDSLRPVLDEPTFLARQRAVGLLQLGRQAEAARQVSTELRINPFNLSLLRSELLDGFYDPLRHRDFLAEFRRLAAQEGADPEEKILAADLLLAGGDDEGAWRAVAGLTRAEPTVLALLQNLATLTSELDLLDQADHYRATIDYLLHALAELMANDTLDLMLRRRAADQLAEVCEHALQAGNLGDDPADAVEKFGELLAEVRILNPTSDRLYAAQIQLADYTRRVLRDPAAAARRLEYLLLDLDLPTEGIALARLALGECYLAAGDTARGRTVLTQLGRDPEFRQAGGYAHYHLARLDLAEGHFATARDRFAVVAMDNPTAAYANEALDLGLAVAEELENPSGGPEILGFYAKSVLLDLLDRPAERLAALQDFVREATLRLDSEEPQHLLERGLYELAQVRAAAGDLAGAHRSLQTIYAEHPDGRYPAQAMALAGRLLQQAGRLEESREIWNRLLAQYPDYLFIDDVRDDLRNLP